MAITQGSTSPIYFFLYQSSDHLTPATGLTPTVTLSKAGGAFAAAAGTVAELSLGWYKLTPTSADTGTLGELAIHATATGADAWDDLREVELSPATQILATPANKLATDASGNVTATLTIAAIAAVLDTVIETNGGTTLTVQQALQLAAALPTGKISGITSAIGAQTFTLRSATDLQVIATITGDELGNRTGIVLTIPA